MKKQFTTTHSYNRNAVQLTIKAPTILELLNSLRQLKAMQGSHTIPPSDEKINTAARLGTLYLLLIWYLKPMAGACMHEDEVSAGHKAVIL